MLEQIVQCAYDGTVEERTHRDETDSAGIDCLPEQIMLEQIQ